MKTSIRFFNDREVRAVWDDELSKWWFSVVDVVGILNDEQDYVKAGNYWRWLKRKLLKTNVQFVSTTHKLKLTAADGKKYKTDMLDSEGICRYAPEAVFLADSFSISRCGVFFISLMTA